MDCELHFVLLWQGVRNINLEGSCWENVSLGLKITCRCESPERSTTEVEPAAPTLTSSIFSSKPQALKDQQPLTQKWSHLLIIIAWKNLKPLLKIYNYKGGNPFYFYKLIESLSKLPKCDVKTKKQLGASKQIKIANEFCLAAFHFQKKAFKETFCFQDVHNHMHT